MDEELEAIRGPYIASLRELRPRLAAWWERLVERDGEEAAGLRWPTGFAGHPSVIAVFREAFLAIEDLNEERREGWSSSVPDPLEEGSWGVEDPEPGRPGIRPYDALVHELRELAPDVIGLVEGMVFVPIGLDEDEDFV